MIGNLVAESANNPGTGTVQLAGALAGRVTFTSFFTNGAAVYYVLTNGTQTEIGYGTFATGSPQTIARNTVLWNSSNTQPSKLSFTGACQVYTAVPAGKAIFKDQNGNVSGNVLVSGTVSGTYVVTGSSGIYVGSGGSITSGDSTVAVAKPLTLNGFLNTTLGGHGAFSGAGTASYQASGNYNYSLITSYALFAGTFCATSDVRLKSDIEPISAEAGAEFVRKITPISFAWTADGQESAGYSAQQLLRHGYSRIVATAPDETVEADAREIDGDTITSPAGVRLTANYAASIPYLHAALQSALARIETLERALAAR